MTTRPPRLLALVFRLALTRSIGSPEAARTTAEAARRYVPPPPLARTPGGRINVQMATYALAVRDALASTGRSPAEAEDLVRRAMYRALRTFRAPLYAAGRIAHPADASARSLLVGKIDRRMIRPPDWLMEEVPCADGYGYDIRRCVLADYLRERGEAGFCERVICAQDFLVSRAYGERLERSSTLAGGAERCDFRFHRPATAGRRGIRSLPDHHARSRVPM